jgi:hypothetical protein
MLHLLKLLDLTEAEIREHITLAEARDLVSGVEHQLAHFPAKADRLYVGEVLGRLSFLYWVEELLDIHNHTKEWRLVYDPEGGRLHFMDMEVFPDADRLRHAMRFVGSQKQVDDICVELVRMQLGEVCHCHLNLDDKDEVYLHRLLFEERRAPIPASLLPAAREGEVLATTQEDHPELNSSVGLL